MRKPYHKPQHEVFIRCMLRHGDTTKAYRAAYPKASKTSARVGGIRLHNYPHIRERIQPILRQRREEANRLARKEALAREKELAIRRDHIRGVLCAMARGEIKKNRHFSINGQKLTLQEDIPHGTLLDLIFLDLKLADGYDRWNSIERQFARLTHNTAHRQQTFSKLPPIPLQGEYIIGRSPFRRIGSKLTNRVEKPKEHPDAEEIIAVLQKRQQTVINWRSNPVPESLLADSCNTENSPKTDNKTSPDNKFEGRQRQFGSST